MSRRIITGAACLALLFASHQVDAVNWGATPVYDKSVPINTGTGIITPGSRPLQPSITTFEEDDDYGAQVSYNKVPLPPNSSILVRTTRPIYQVADEVNNIPSDTRDFKIPIRSSKYPPMPSKTTFDEDNNSIWNLSKEQLALSRSIGGGGVFHDGQTPFPTSTTSVLNRNMPRPQNNNVNFATFEQDEDDELQGIRGSGGGPKNGSVHYDGTTAIPTGIPIIARCTDRTKCDQLYPINREMPAFEEDEEEELQGIQGDDLPGLVAPVRRETTVLPSTSITRCTGSKCDQINRERTTLFEEDELQFRRTGFAVYREGDKAIGQSSSIIQRGVIRPMQSTFDEDNNSLQFIKVATAGALPYREGNTPFDPSDNSSKLRRRTTRPQYEEQVLFEEPDNNNNINIISAAGYIIPIPQVTNSRDERHVLNNYNSQFRRGARPQSQHEHHHDHNNNNNNNISFDEDEQIELQSYKSSAPRGAVIGDRQILNNPVQSTFIRNNNNNIRSEIDPRMMIAEEENEDEVQAIRFKSKPVLKTATMSRYAAVLALDEDEDEEFIKQKPTKSKLSLPKRRHINNNDLVDNVESKNLNIYSTMNEHESEGNNPHRKRLLRGTRLYDEDNDEILSARQFYQPSRTAIQFEEDEVQSIYKPMSVFVPPDSIKPIKTTETQTFDENEYISYPRVVDPTTLRRTSNPNQVWDEDELYIDFIKIVDPSTLQPRNNTNTRLPSIILLEEDNESWSTPKKHAPFQRLVQSNHLQPIQFNTNEEFDF